MKNKEVRGILALIVVTALSFGVIAGSRALSQDMAGGAAEGGSGAAVAEELDVSGAENIEEAVRLEDGAYAVTVREAGYASDIVLRVTFEDDAETLRQVEVLEQNETETLGSRITEPEFLDQFAGAKAPVYLPGMTVEAGVPGDNAADGAEAEAETGAAAELPALEGAVLADGTYEAQGEPADGYTDQVSITVTDGKITEVNWDSIGEDGSSKNVMSENGEYVMTEDGLTWAEQSEALANALIENQSLTFLNPDEQGKTDAVSGVSISVNGFIELASQCLVQAAGLEWAPEGQPEASAATLADGSYTAASAPVDGYTDQVTITVEGGRITEVNWDSIGEDGSSKSVMSENGEYVMTEDGLTWAEQSEALANALIENQSLAFLNPDEQGKTDAVSGVSISVNGFISLAQQCLDQAAGIEGAEDGAASGEEAADGTETGSTEAGGTASQAGTQVDGVSGATRSSTAAVTAINDAYSFLQTVE